MVYTFANAMVKEAGHIVVWWSWARTARCRSLG